MTTAQKQDAVDLLVRQHEQIKQLFSELASAQGTSKRELFESLVRLLAVHESAEEELVHPLAQREIRSGQSIVEARLEEEQQAKQALADLYNLGIEHPEFDKKLAHLREAVIAHAEHEEHEEFPYLREAVPGERLQRLAGTLRTAEKMAPTRPHPGAPPSATATMLLGPPLAMFDRARDAVRDARQSDNSAH